MTETIEQPSTPAAALDPTEAVDDLLRSLKSHTEGLSSREAAATLLGQVPLAPSGLGVVEAGLTGTLAVIGVNGGAAVLARLAYRLFNYWLHLPAGLIGLLLHRRSTTRRNPPDASVRARASCTE